MTIFAGRLGINAPGLNWMPINSASGGQNAGVALVDGPRRVMVVLPLYFVTANPHSISAMEIKGPVRSPWLRQILSTKGASDSFSSHIKSILLPHAYV